MYALLFLIGFFGFVGMAGLSFLHSGHQSHSGNHGSTGEALGSIRAMSHAHGARIAPGKLAAPKTAGLKGAKGPRFRPWWAISPFDIFGYCLGAGAVGELLRQGGVAPHLIVFAAVVGALVFNFGLAKPVLNTVLKFASRESEGLEGMVAQRVEAVTRFDAQGRGLVGFAMDGELYQVLAHLEPEERDRGVTVGKGDPLLVIEVDAARNTCRVTRELAS